MKHAIGFIIFAVLISFNITKSFADDSKVKLSSKGIEMSNKLGIEDPAHYWSKDFDKIDKDSDGYLSKDELSEAYPEYGKDAFQYFDHSQDGWISLAEFFNMFE